MKKLLLVLALFLAVPCFAVDCETFCKMGWEEAEAKLTPGERLDGFYYCTIKNTLQEKNYDRFYELLDDGDPYRLGESDYRGAKFITDYKTEKSVYQYFYFIGNFLADIHKSLSGEFTDFNHGRFVEQNYREYKYMEDMLTQEHKQLYISIDTFLRNNQKSITQNQTALDVAILKLMMIRKYTPSQDLRIRYMSWITKLSIYSKVFSNQTRRNNISNIIENIQ